MKTVLSPAKDVWKDVTNHEDALKHGEIRYKYHVADKRSDEGRRIYKQEAVKALYDIVNYCQKIGVTPILITTPYLKEYSDAVRWNDPEFYSEFYALIYEIVKNTGVKYYGYSFDERYSNNYEYFFNTDHLNRKGARIFTNNLIQEILYKKYLELKYCPRNNLTGEVFVCCTVSNSLLTTTSESAKQASIVLFCYNSLIL